MQGIKVKIKKINENAIIPYKTHDSDFCYDCVATSEEELSPNVWRYGLGFALEASTDDINEEFGDNGNFSFDIRPRSSIWKTGMMLSNSIGTVDLDYRGELIAVFYHIMPKMERYKVGDRICQIKFGMTMPFDFEVVSELSETKRGEGGYGSTGK